MLALWIILAILAGLFLLSMASLVLDVEIGEDTRLRVGALGIRIPLLDTRPDSPRQKVAALKRKAAGEEKKAEKEERKKKKEEKKKARAARKAARKAKKRGSAAPQGAQRQSAPPEKDGFSLSVGEIVGLIRECFPWAGYILGHLRFRHVVIALNVGAPDAKDAALRYGQLQAGVQATLRFLQGAGAKVQIDALCIQPDFVSGEFRQWVSFRLKLRLGVIILGAAGILLKIIRFYLGGQKQPPQKASQKPVPTKKAAQKSEV